MKQFSYIIKDEIGLHARTEGLLAKEANKEDATTETAGTTGWDGGPVAAKQWMCGTETGINRSFRGGE